MISNEEKVNLSKFISDTIELNIQQSNTFLYNNNEILNNYSMFNVPEHINISFIDYVTLIINNFKCNFVCYIYALIYMDRIFNKCNIYLNKINMYKIFSISLLCAHKYIDDDVYSNKYYSIISLIKLSEINKLEKIYLNKINYDLYVKNDVFYEYVSKMPVWIADIINNKKLHMGF